MGTMKLGYLHTIVILSIFLHLSSSQTSMAHQCLDDQLSTLMQFKNDSFSESSSLPSSKLATWMPDMNCCLWKGITCDNSTSHVIGLDLSNGGLTGRIDSKSSLFKLHTLQRMDLSGNFFALAPQTNVVGAPYAIGTVEITPVSSPEFPQILITSRFGQLANLTHVNLANTGFSSQIPLEMSHLTRMVSLNLSGNQLKLENPNLKMIVQNMSSLRELQLDGIDMSSGNSEWPAALSSSLPNLCMLCLSGCSISDPILSALSNFHLSDINLSNKNLSTEVPEFLADFSSLTSIVLSCCRLHGEFPKDMFKLPNLKELDVSFNPNIFSSLPEFP